MTVEWLDGITDIFSDVTSLRCRISIVIRHSQAIEWQGHQQSVVKPKDATTSCKNTWVTVPYFGLNDLLMALCLWSPLLPISKLLAIQDHAKKTWRNQHAKKVVSDRPGLVDFSIGLVNSMFNLPNKQVMFFEEFKYQKNCEFNSAGQKVFGASWNDVWASKC